MTLAATLLAQGGEEVLARIRAQQG
jgi:hypothetical protein